MSPPSIKSPYRLMVEGPDDKHTVIHLLSRHGYDWNDVSMVRPFVEDAGGVEKLLNKDVLSAALKTYDRLALVFDADLPPTNRWHQARDLLTHLGLTLPAQPARGGTIVNGLRPNTRVGVWIMPDNAQPGRLEEFIEKLIPPKDPVWPHAQEATTQALALGAKLREQDHVKGALHAWLAWQENPGQPFGTALFTHVLRHDSQEALRFVDWFKQCFT